MAKMAELHAALTELPDEALDFMQGFYRGRAEGVIVEQERIIKLLEEMRDACLSVTSKIGDHNAWTLENAIALIKGENN